MRKIKFRGKNKDGKWVYGFLDYKAYETHFVIHELADLPPSNYDPCGSIHSEYYEVEPETVGQFTGLQDKNGVDIYEGDLIKNKSGRICEVVWQKYSAQWDYKPITDEGKYNGFQSHLIKFQEVIGNIHEDKK